jgi:hypothetical protein
MQNQDTTKFEFILKLENNIVIQRFFIVTHYNPKMKNSMELYETVTEVCEEIAEDLKYKTLDIMSLNDEYATEEQREEERSKYKEEYFILEIKLGDAVFISRIFPGHIYHPKVRYAVDIRPKVRKILGDLTNVLSSRELNKSYLGYVLR